MLIGKAVEKSGVTLLARILGNAGTPITQASLSTITYTVQDLTLGTNIATGTALVISAVVFDTLQTGPIWTKDLVGYNFKATLPANSFADGGSTYQVDVAFTPVSGEAFRQSWQFYLQNVFG